MLDVGVLRTIRNGTCAKNLSLPEIKTLQQKFVNLTIASDTLRQLNEVSLKTYILKS